MNRTLRSLVLLALGAALLPLAHRAAASGDAAGAVPSDPGRPRVVVSVLDSAINPYHEFFYRQPSSVTKEVLAEIGVPPENVVQLTRTGNLGADRAADAEFWERVQRGQLYHFLGTNIVATSLATATASRPLLQPTATKSPHGVGTTAAVLEANPDAVILFVEANDSLGSADSHGFAFRHPAVDIVSTSYGASVASGLVPLPENRAFTHSHDGVVGRGKMHFSSGGNGPGLTPLRAGAGPWWSIGVSGIEEGSSEGDTALSGNFPDFVSDFTQSLPYCMNCEAGTRTVSGTSFSTPRAAGVASKVLLDVRRRLGHAGGIRTVDERPVMATNAPVGTCQGGAPAGCTALDNWSLRRALEHAAWVPQTAAYNPAAAAGGGVGVPVNPVAPWLQTGWGDLSAEQDKGVHDEALAHLGFGTAARTKPPGFCEFQTAVVQARKAWWDRVAPVTPVGATGGERPPGPPAKDPFVYCQPAVRSPLG